MPAMAKPPSLAIFESIIWRSILLLYRRNALRKITPRGYFSGGRIPSRRDGTTCTFVSG